MLHLLVSFFLAADGGAADLVWNARTIEHVRVDFPGPAASIVEKKWDSGGSTQFTSLLTGDDETFRVNVRAEKGEGLEALRLDHPSPPWKFGKVESVKVCGKSAQKVVVTQAGRQIACVETTDGVGSGPRYFPARRVVALVFSHRGLVVRVTLESEADRPGAHDAMFEHVVQSIRCED